jgi:hypothetical protein
MTTIRKNLVFAGVFSFLVSSSFAQSSGTGINLSNADTSVDVTLKKITPDSTSFQHAEGTSADKTNKGLVKSEPIVIKSSSTLPDSLQPVPVIIITPIPVIKFHHSKCNGGS